MIGFENREMGPGQQTRELLSPENLSNVVALT